MTAMKIEVDFRLVDTRISASEKDLPVFLNN